MCSELFVVKVLIRTNIVEINILGDAYLKPGENRGKRVSKILGAIVLCVIVNRMFVCLSDKHKYIDIVY